MEDLRCLEPTQERAHYFNNPKFSDVTIHFSGHEVKAHRVTLASHSSYFRKMFEGEFLEASVRDVHLFEDDPGAVYGMLAYFYDCTYRGQSERGEPNIYPRIPNTPFRGGFEGKEGREHIKYIVRVYGVADKYGVLGLMTLVEERFENMMEWLKDRYVTPFTNIWCANELVSIFEEVAELLYHQLGCVAYELRDALANAVHERTLELRDNRRYVQMVEKIPEFSVDLLRLATTAMRDLDLQLTKKNVVQTTDSVAVE